MTAMSASRGHARYAAGSRHRLHYPAELPIEPTLHAQDRLVRERSATIRTSRTGVRLGLEADLIEHTGEVTGRRRRCRLLGTGLLLRAWLLSSWWVGGGSWRSGRRGRPPRYLQRLSTLGALHPFARQGLVGCKTLTAGAGDFNWHTRQKSKRRLTQTQFRKAVTIVTR